MRGSLALLRLCVVGVAGGVLADFRAAERGAGAVMVRRLVARLQRLQAQATMDPPQALLEAMDFETLFNLCRLCHTMRR